MALFAISDLHLSFGVNKPMDVFGGSWMDYESRMAHNWNSIVQKEDTVLLPGDISWATYMDDGVPDFEYIHKLNGQKIISKGNHDYWWSTMSKLNDFCSKHGFSTISFLQNNSYEAEGVTVCGTRGWLPYSSCTTDEDKKIYNRELERLHLSLTAGVGDKKWAMLHYPPDEEFIQLMKKYYVERCVFGHLHAKAHGSARQGTIEGIEFSLVSCDYLGFTPKRLGEVYV